MPALHRDPSDRMLGVQARAEDLVLVLVLVLVTSDTAVADHSGDIV